MPVVFNELEVQPVESTTPQAVAQPAQDSAPKGYIRLTQLSDAQRRLETRAERVRAH
jgi:hypothetical protein